VRIDLNCDMGEGLGGREVDEEMMSLVSSANVACGFHASEPGNMHRTVRLAKAHGVAVGAHPSYPDRPGFGRRDLAASPDQVRDDVLYQVGALLAFCRAEGVPLCHVKAHGALYNAAAKDLPTALAVAEAVRSVDPNLWLVCLFGSAQVEAARRTGLRYVEEVFADRAYSRDGRLVPRTTPGSVIDDAAAVGERVLRMVKEGKVHSLDGTDIAVGGGTICVHGDTPGSVELARAIRDRLLAEGVELAPFSREET